MILTCPECASRYFVDDARVGPKGRTVRCAGCGHSWRAAPLPDAEPPLALSTPVEAPPTRDQALPERLRAEALEKKKSREAVAAGVVWGLIGAGFAALVLGAVLFRVDVVRLWPKTASAYALAHLPVNPTGLALENTQGSPTLISGHAALAVTGVERNIASDARPTMPVRVVLYDKAGKRLASGVTALPQIRLPAGGAQSYSVNFLDPPQGVSNAVVAFAFDVAPARRSPAAARPRPRRAPAAQTPLQAAASGAPPGPAAPGRPLPGRIAAAAPPPGPPAALPLHAAEARPLPSNSPYALPASAIQQVTR